MADLEMLTKTLLGISAELNAIKEVLYEAGLVSPDALAEKVQDHWRKIGQLQELQQGLNAARLRDLLDT
jgi:hypothetical protein